MSSPSPKTIVNIDASSLSSLNCFRRYWNKFVLGYRPEGLYLNDTEFGSAWHIFRNVLGKERDEPKAVTMALSYFKTRREQGMIFKEKKEHLNEEFLSLLCMKYLREYGKEKSWGKYEYLRSPVDNAPLVEQSFSIKIFENEACVINLQGTMDEIVIHPAGYLIIGDDKTTSQWDVKKHLRSFAMKPQLRFYRLAFQLLANQVGGEWFKEILATRRIGCKINGIFLKTDFDKVTFEQSDVMFFEDEDLERFEIGLRKLAEHIATGITHSFEHPQEPEGILNDSCNGMYGQPCEFANICRLPTTVYANALKQINRASYEPLNFRKL